MCISYLSDVCCLPTHLILLLFLYVNSQLLDLHSYSKNLTADVNRSIFV